MSAAVIAVATDPIWNPHAWDIVSLLGEDAPGLAHVSEPSRDYEWDVKVGRGTNGATTTFIGFQPAKFSVKWEIWTASQMKAWAALVKRLKYDPTKIRYDFATNYTSGLSAIDIYHPALAFVDFIRDFVSVAIGDSREISVIRTDKARGIGEPSTKWAHWQIALARVVRALLPLLDPNDPEADVSGAVIIGAETDACDRSEFLRRFALMVRGDAGGFVVIFKADAGARALDLLGLSDLAQEARGIVAPSFLLVVISAIGVEGFRLDRLGDADDARPFADPIPAAHVARRQVSTS